MIVIETRGNSEIMDPDGYRSIAAVISAADFSATAVQGTETVSAASVILLLIFLTLKAFYAACEFVFTEIPDSRVRALGERSNASAGEKRLYRLLQKPAKLMTCFSVQRVLSTVIIAYLAALTFHQPLENAFLTCYLHFFNQEGALPDLTVLMGMMLLAFIVLICLVTFITVVLCEGLPRRIISPERASKFAAACSGPVAVLIVLLTPAATLCSAATGLLGKLFGVKNNHSRDVVTEEEILMMVDAGNETGVLEESQKEMINNIFEFGDLEVSDVMTHRTDMTAVELGDKISDVVSMAINSGRSRIPVYKDTIDSIVGILNVKDLLCLVGCESTDGFAISDFLREAVYVPATNKCGEVFEDMTANRCPMAIAVDEYGGTAGLVTMEDLLEAIVGNIRDEYDDEEEDIVEISPGICTIDGTADPDEVMEQLGLTLPEDHGYDTMGGFLVDLLGRFPESDENPVVEYQGTKFTVLVTDDRRISKIKAVTTPVASPVRTDSSS